MTHARIPFLDRVRCTRRGFLGMALLGALPGRLRAQATVPIRLSRYPLAFVEVHVNGRAAQALLDTGSARRVQISGRLAEALSLASVGDGEATQRYGSGRQSARRVELDRLAVGDEIATCVAEVVDGDIERIARQTGDDFDLILGWGWFRERRCGLDLPQRVLRPSLPEGLADAATNATVLPLETSARVPIVTGRLDDAPCRLLLDTGAPTCAVHAETTGGLRRARIALGTIEHEVDVRPKDLSALRSTTGVEAVLGLNWLAAHALELAADRIVISG